MVGAVGHLEGGMLVVDAVREILAPFDPEIGHRRARAAVPLLRHQHHAWRRLFSSHGVSTAFERRAIQYRHCELPRTALYLNLLPYLNARTIRLLDHPKTVNQIAALERRTARGARDSSTIRVISTTISPTRSPASPLRRRSARAVPDLPWHVRRRGPRLSQAPRRAARPLHDQSAEPAVHAGLSARADRAVSWRVHRVEDELPTKKY